VEKLENSRKIAKNLKIRKIKGNSGKIGEIGKFGKLLENCKKLSINRPGKKIFFDFLKNGENKVLEPI